MRASRTSRSTPGGGRRAAGEAYPEQPPHQHCERPDQAVLGRALAEDRQDALGRSLTANTTARKALLERDVADLEGIAAPRPPELVRAVEAHVEAVVADLLTVAPVQGARVTIRHDWTWRTEKAKAPRSRGGIYTGRFRGYEDDETYDRGGGISLRLAKVVRADTDMDAADRTFGEYGTINGDREIGLYGPCDTWAYLTLLTAHETAHAIHYISGSGGMPHGAQWQAIYRGFRQYLGLTRDWDLTKANVEKHIGPEMVELMFPGPDGVCGHCGKQFYAKRTTKQYCSPKCRAAAHRAASSR